MKLSLLALDLARWDETPRDALLLPVFRDQRPLRGAAGLADWRLCGRLTRLVRSARMNGERGETLMLPPGRRLTFRRLFLFGIGSSEGYDEHRLRDDLFWMRRVAADAGANDVALEAPGRASGAIGVRRALEVVLEACRDGDGDLRLIDRPAAHKEMAEQLRLQGR